MAEGFRSQKRMRSQRKRPSISDINVTPFVDVMLVLLVIFMITAPLLTTGVEVDLPETSTGPVLGTDEPLAITITGDGQIFLQETLIELSTLPAKLDAVTGRNPKARLFIRGDQSINYGRVMEVMGTVNGAGYLRVALVTKSPVAVQVTGDKLKGPRRDYDSGGKK